MRLCIGGSTFLSRSSLSDRFGLGRSEPLPPLREPQPEEAQVTAGVVYGIDVRADATRTSRWYDDDSASTRTTPVELGAWTKRAESTAIASRSTASRQ